MEITLRNRKWTPNQIRGHRNGAVDQKVTRTGNAVCALYNERWAHTPQHQSWRIVIQKFNEEAKDE